VEQTIFWDESSVGLGDGYVGRTLVQTDLNDEIQVSLGGTHRFVLSDAKSARTLAAMLDAAAAFLEGK
jgi:hypothetical protein